MQGRDTHACTKVHAATAGLLLIPKLAHLKLAQISQHYTEICSIVILSVSIESILMNGTSSHYGAREICF